MANKLKQFLLIISGVQTMTNKKQEKENKLHIINVNNNDSLSAGICGPDGCVLDWSKADKGEKHE